MGYDMYVEEPPVEVIERVAAARREFEEAVNLRNSFERGTPDYNTAQERVEILFECLHPIELSFRFNIWGMATARRLMTQAGVRAETISHFDTNGGELVTPEECEQVAALLNTRYATADPVQGFTRIVGDLAMGDMPASWELKMTGALLGAMDAGGAVQLETPGILRHVPSVEELNRRADAGELDAETVEALNEARMWLDYITEFATFNEKAATGGGYRVH